MDEVRYAPTSDGISIAYQLVEGALVDRVTALGSVTHFEVLWEHPLSARFLRNLVRFSRPSSSTRGGSDSPTPTWPIARSRRAWAARVRSPRRPARGDRWSSTLPRGDRWRPFTRGELLLLKNHVSVVLKIGALIGIKVPNVLRKWNRPTIQDTPIKHRRNQEVPLAREGDESPIEQVVDVWRQQEPVCPINLLVIIGVAPRLDVACSEMLDGTHTSYATL